MGSLMCLNSEPSRTWKKRQAEHRAASLRQRRGEKKAEEEEEAAGGAPAPHAGSYDPFWARSCSSHPPTMAGKEEIPWGWGKDRKNPYPRQEYRQNSVSNYKVAFFPQRLREVPSEILPSGLQSLCAGAVHRGCSVTENRGQHLFIVR